ncbi:MAG: hypothetical protein J6R67_03725 [Treponema sp.]|nr:hypothetical protein [Treponema sp.]
MKEKLIKYWERKERQMKQSAEYKVNFLSQAFGALEFAMETLDNWDDEAELIDLWNDEWKPRLEAIVYEV